MRTPEFAHRLVRVFPIAQDIARKNIAERCFILNTHRMIFGHSRYHGIIVFFYQARADIAPIKKKLLGFRLAFKNVSEKRGQIRPKLVSGTLFKFLFHSPRPILYSALPAVDQNSIDFNARFQKPPDIPVEVRFKSARIHLIALPPGRLGWSRMVFALHIHMTENKFALYGIF